MKPSLLFACLAPLALCSSACRDATSGGAGASVGFLPSLEAAGGCNGSDQVFTVGQALTAVPLASWTGDAVSQVAGARGGELLYLSGAGATVVEVDLSGGGLPVETVLVTPGTVQALLDPLAAGPAPVLSGLTVLDADHLVVMEHSFNVLLLVSRSVPDAVSVFAGIPNPTPGFADGPGSLARFHFAEAAQLVATGAGELLVADSGNHAVRRVRDDFVETLAGTGAPFHADGGLAASLFDTPSGLSLSCAGRLLVTELGASSAGGHRVRVLELGAESFFGLQGSVDSLAGDGTAAVLGGLGTAAQVDAPMGVVTSGEGQAYWLDAGAGILRRWDPVTGAVDCPLWSDCASAVAGVASFTAGGVHSLAASDGGVLYALDAAAGELLRITP